MHVPIKNRHPLNFLVSLLRIARSDSYVIEETKAHRSIRRGVMSGRTHRHESVLRRAFHHCIDRLARRARSTQCGLERIARNQGVVIKVAFAFAYCFLDMFVVLRRVAGLDVAAPRFAGFGL